METPVRLPPGRLRAGTKPIRTGSEPTRKTVGIVWVAARAASEVGVLLVTITVTCRLTNSAASAGTRSFSPSAQRYSNATFLPSAKPASANPRWKASKYCRAVCNDSLLR